jgi:hypothetical protein
MMIFKTTIGIDVTMYDGTLKNIDSVMHSIIIPQMEVAIACTWYRSYLVSELL